MKDTPPRLTYRVPKRPALVWSLLRPDFWTGGLTWELLCSNKPILLLFQFGLFRPTALVEKRIIKLQKTCYLGAQNPGGVEPSRWVNRVLQPHGGHSSLFIFLSTGCDRLSTWGKLPISEPPPTEVPDTSSGSRPLLGQRPPRILCQAMATAGQAGSILFWINDNLCSQGLFCLETSFPKAAPTHRAPPQAVVGATSP